MESSFQTARLQRLVCTIPFIEWQLINIAFPEIPGIPSISQKELANPSIRPALFRWRGEFAFEAEPYTLASSPHQLFSLLGWLIDTGHGEKLILHKSYCTELPLDRPPPANTLGFCDYWKETFSCSSCQSYFSARIQKKSPLELGTRKIEGNDIPKIAIDDGAGKERKLVNVVMRPRFVRNHLLDSLFGKEAAEADVEDAGYAVFCEMVRLNTAFFLTELCWEIIQLVGQIRKERVFYKLPDVGQERDGDDAREVTRDCLRTVQEVADGLVLGTSFVDVETWEVLGPRMGTDPFALWGRPFVPGLPKAVGEAIWPTT
jgi:hypothetical protein